MAAKHSVRRAAVRDVAAAFDWYEQQTPGLGKEFVAEFQACVLAACRHPEMYAVYRRHYCRTVIGRFSYVMYYTFSSDRVVVRAVFHTSVGPAKVNKRLP